MNSFNYLKIKKRNIFLTSLLVISCSVLISSKVKGDEGDKGKDKLQPSCYQTPNTSLNSLTRICSTLTQTEVRALELGLRLLSDFTQLILPLEYDFNPTLPENSKIVNSLEKSIGDVASLLGDRESDRFRKALKDFIENPQQIVMMKRELLNFRNHLFKFAFLHKDSTNGNSLFQKECYKSLAQIVKAALLKFRPLLLPVVSSNREQLADIDLDRELTLEELKIPRELGTTPWSDSEDGDVKSIKRLVIGEYVKSSDPFIMKVIEHIRSEGGGVFAIKGANEKGELFKGINPTFIVSASNGTPGIYINLNNPYALSSLAHEYTHFNSWLKKKNELEKKLFLSKKEAGIKAQSYFAEAIPALVADEKLAQENEEKIVREYPNSLFNRGAYQQNIPGRDLFYYTRHNYPNNEGIRKALQEHIQSKKELNKPLVKKMILENLKNVLKARKEIFNFYQVKIAKERKGLSKEEALLKKEYADHYTNFIRYFSIYDFIFMDEIPRFREGGSEDLLKALYQEVIKDMGIKVDSYKIDERDQIFF